MDINTFKLQPHKMVIHTQTIRRLLPTVADDFFECIWPFCGVGLGRVKIKVIMFYLTEKLLKFLRNWDYIYSWILGLPHWGYTWGYWIVDTTFQLPAFMKAISPRLSTQHSRFQNQPPWDCHKIAVLKVLEN